ncbi:uncharacterized protein LOC117296739 [Asterias rubens]|uniref:uncharacterized protein LOC117296739 n=1 Tax=Asterias rubens TaxID=7604 RepID=UPI001455363C|nr:uncharacterized protein LOC117296739 [Asterias rubens]
MFLVNLVPLLLAVGVLTQSGDENLTEEPDNLRDVIICVIENVVRYSNEQDTEAVLSLFDKNAMILIDGFPPFVGHDEIRLVADNIAERAASIEDDYKEIEAMDKDENLVYERHHFKFFNDLGEKYIEGNFLAIFKKTPDGYKFHILMFNKRKQEEEA